MHNRPLRGMPIRRCEHADGHGSNDAEGRPSVEPVENEDAIAGVNPPGIAEDGWFSCSLYCAPSETHSGSGQ